MSEDGSSLYSNNVNMRHVYVMSVFVSIAIGELFLHDFLKNAENNRDKYDPNKKEWKTKFYEVLSWIDKILFIIGYFIMVFGFVFGLFYVTSAIARKFE